VFRFDRYVFLCLAIVLLKTTAAPESVNAQTQTPAASASASNSSSAAPSEAGWHFGISPYLWMANVHGTVGAVGQTASVHASFSDLLSSLNMGLMTAAELRYNRIVMPVDFMWIKFSDEQSLPPGLAGTSTKTEMTETILTSKVGYRFVDTPKIKVAALGGFRYWHLGLTLTSQPSGPAPSRSANWVDALAGGRVQAKLTPRLGLMVAGDIGGGGADSDYQANGFLGYQLSEKWALAGGYRYLAVNYRPNTNAGFINDTATSGVLLGVTWTMK